MSGLGLGQEGCAGAARTGGEEEGNQLPALRSPPFPRLPPLWYPCKAVSLEPVQGPPPTAPTSTPHTRLCPSGQAPKTPPELSLPWGPSTAPLPCTNEATRPTPRAGGRITPLSQQLPTHSLLGVPSWPPSPTGQCGKGLPAPDPHPIKHQSWSLEELGLGVPKRRPLPLLPSSREPL